MRHAIEPRTSVKKWLLDTTAGNLAIILSTTALLFLAAPLLFGSVTVLFKLFLGLVIPASLLTLTALLTNLVYAKVALPLCSKLLGGVIWEVGARGTKRFSLFGQYGLNDAILTNPGTIADACCSILHYSLLCGTLNVYVHHAYHQLLMPTFYDLLLSGVIGGWIGSALMFSPILLKDTGNTKMSIFGLLALGTTNGVLLTCSQLTIGHFLCHSVLDLGYFGAIIGCAVNLFISPYLAKTLLQLSSSMADPQPTTLAALGN